MKQESSHLDEGSEKQGSQGSGRGGEVLNDCGGRGTDESVVWVVGVGGWWMVDGSGFVAGEKCSLDRWESGQSGF